MSDLVEFLRTRLDEDEQAAKVIQVGGFHPPTWIVRRGRSRRWMEVVGRSVALGNSDADWCDDGLIALVPDSRCEWAHIARHDPARVLREVEAKREIVTLYERADQNARALIDREARGDARIERAALLGALLALALPYVDHPDYQQEWNLNLA